MCGSVYSHQIYDVSDTRADSLELVGVVCRRLTGNPLELLEPGTGLRQSLSDLLGLVRASVELGTHCMLLFCRETINYLL